MENKHRKNTTYAFLPQHENTATRILGKDLIDKTQGSLQPPCHLVLYAARQVDVVLYLLSSYDTSSRLTEAMFTLEHMPLRGPSSDENAKFLLETAITQKCLL